MPTLKECLCESGLDTGTLGEHLQSILQKTHEKDGQKIASKIPPKISIQKLGIKSKAIKVHTKPNTNIEHKEVTIWPCSK